MLGTYLVKVMKKRKLTLFLSSLSPWPGVNAHVCLQTNTILVLYHIAKFYQVEMVIRSCAKACGSQTECHGRQAICCVHCIMCKKQEHLVYWMAAQKGRHCLFQRRSPAYISSSWKSYIGEV